ncbi:uncharacterized protein [Coffea arabica]|uniref:Reverse transcriptase zinc-binding domain-containing protein n=1 Tax=Coffea arabica TaxID=13443 RepID=A0A6P6VI28_COFAR|nr:uncharacterized protein LOC113723436 [Coffea arabica]XP_027102339.1 uncharacterized protein LOC113723458 [Coffea arabica]XP_027109264.1 uncharacterized protein LOC113729135 [Coffea arabica]
MEDREWVAWKLAEVLPCVMVQQVLAVVGPDGAFPDRMILLASTSGQFSLSSTYREVREMKPLSFLFRQIWDASVPLKVSFFMLRLLSNRLPLDDVLVARGFQLPSKCSCCLVSNTESLRHLFLEGELATTVWQFFGSVGRLALNVNHVWVWLIGWWLKPMKSEQLRFMFRILPSLICWHIWKARNTAVFQGSVQLPTEFASRGQSIITRAADMCATGL